MHTSALNAEKNAKKKISLYPDKVNIQSATPLLCETLPSYLMDD